MEFNITSHSYWASIKVKSDDGIQGAQLADSGIYICQAQVGAEIVRDNVTLNVGGKLNRKMIKSIYM